jgi:hypothetical protein
MIPRQSTYLLASHLAPAPRSALLPTDTMLRCHHMLELEQPNIIAEVIGTILC